MELECAKYHETIDSEQAACRHPDDYCRYRTLCMIHFLEKENRRKASGISAGRDEKSNAGERDSG
jgi:hypothetical protein